MRARRARGVLCGCRGSRKLTGHWPQSRSWGPLTSLSGGTRAPRPLHAPTVQEAGTSGRLLPSVTHCHSVPGPLRVFTALLLYTRRHAIAAFQPRDQSGGPFPALTTHRDPKETIPASRTQNGNLNPDPHVFTPEHCRVWMRSRCPQLVSRATPNQDKCPLSFPPQQQVCRPVVRLDISSDPHLLSFPAKSTMPFYRGPPHRTPDPDDGLPPTPSTRTAFLLEEVSVLQPLSSAFVGPQNIHDAAERSQPHSDQFLPGWLETSHSFPGSWALQSSTQLL